MDDSDGKDGCAPDGILDREGVPSGVLRPDAGVLGVDRLAK